jgi:DEAD/DEAH box helicase domain-containing protein
VEARIDDSAEDREPKFYTRQLLASFEPQDIREAYRLRAPDLPFGFEFIERAIFRDINFGEPTKRGDTYFVAGRQSTRPGFKLCRHCGQVQREPRNARERQQGQLHAFDCPKYGNKEPENVIDCLYLYREISSEALRILIPYTRSGVDETSIQSFMAALQLGLKRRFGGRVDHLRMTTQQERGRDGAATRQYIMLYDSVPGGTGYLHELLANQAATLVEVFRLALSHIVNCPCNAKPEKDGCYRCVYQHRLSRAMALVSRDRARAILEQVVENLNQLERVTSVADIYVNPNFDSELEARFIESLRRLSGRGGLPVVKLVQDVVRGKSGYLLEAAGQRYWIEPQVEFGANDGVRTPSRPDFVFWPAQSRSARRPIAVFCDGWAYHKSCTREDAAKRNALLASGKFWVWSVTWSDVKAALEGNSATDLSAALEKMCFNAYEAIPQVLRDKYDSKLWTQNAVASLVLWLSKPTDEIADGYAANLTRHAGATAFRMIPHPHDSNLKNARDILTRFWGSLQELPCEKPMQSVACGNVDSISMQFRYWWPADVAKTDVPVPRSPGFVALDDLESDDEPGRHNAWQLWLWVFNILQHLPGVFLATRAGLEGGDYKTLSVSDLARSTVGVTAAVEQAAWNDVIGQAMGELSEGLLALAAYSVPPPDEVGYEFAEDGDVVAEAELVWTARKVVLLMHADGEPPWSSRGWTTVIATSGWPERVAKELKEKG